MNIMIFASTPISHIFPLKPLVAELLKRGNKVYCLSCIERKELIESYGCVFLEYPFNFEKKGLPLNLGEKLYELEYLWDKQRYEEAMIEYMKYDLKRVNNVSVESLEMVEKIIKKYKVDLIYRDAVEKHAYILSKKMNIKCIGYITHNLYSLDFFEQNPENLFRVFMNCKNFYQISDGFFKKYYHILEQLNNVEKLGMTEFNMLPLHQFDPREKFNIIFSTKLLQPKYYGKNYKIIYPSIDRFLIEENIPKKLKNFIDKAHEMNRKIVYISTGSILSNNIDYYVNFANFFTANNICVVISLKHNLERTKAILEELIEKDMVYIEEFVPQKYILKNSSLFVSSGGQNSIIEAMYYKVPMLINPMTSEQRINGVWLDSLKLVKTSYKLEGDNKIGKLISELLNSSDIKNKIKNVSNDLRTHENNFDEMWEFIYGRN